MVGSVLLGVMVLFILASQKQFEMLLYKMMPRSAIHRLRRYQKKKYLLTGTKVLAYWYSRLWETCPLLISMHRP